MKSKFWFQSGVLIIYGQSLDTQPHQHHALQVVWPTENSICKLNNQDTSNCIIIDSDYSHQLHISEGWVILIEPQSELGEKLKGLLDGLNFKFVNDIKAFQNQELQSIKTPVSLLTPLEKRLGIKLNDPQSLTTDSRIQSLLEKLNQCFTQDCIKPEHWLASDVASELALSESRFLHLFKQEMEIAWRPFLLWRRILCAILMMYKGASATQAAYQAGFSDSSHLSRTFKSMFGIKIQQVQKTFSQKP